MYNDVPGLARQTDILLTFCGDWWVIGIHTTFTIQTTNYEENYKIDMLSC